MALFLYSIGPDAVKIYNSFDLSEANRTRLRQRMPIKWRLLVETKTKESKQAGNMQTRNRMMTGCFREISHVFSVEENIDKAEPTVQLGAVCGERVA